QFLVFDPKRHASFSDVGDATLRDGWPPYIATGISQEVLFRPEGLNLDTPPAPFLVCEHRFHLISGHLRMEQPSSQGRGNQFSARANRGLSDFDRTHRFVLNGVWDIPKFSWTSSSRAKQILFSNWQLYC